MRFSRILSYLIPNWLSPCTRDLLRQRFLILAWLSGSPFGHISYHKLEVKEPIEHLRWHNASSSTSCLGDRKFYVRTSVTIDTLSPFLYYNCAAPECKPVILVDVLQGINNDLMNLRAEVRNLRDEVRIGMAESRNTRTHLRNHFSRQTTLLEKVYVNHQVDLLVVDERIAAYVSRPLGLVSCLLKHSLETSTMPQEKRWIYSPLVNPPQR